MKHLGILILALVSGCLASCTFTTKDKAEWEFFFGTSIGLRTGASETKASGSVNTDFPALEEWFRASQDGPVPPGDTPPTN